MSEPTKSQLPPTATQIPAGVARPDIAEQVLEHFHQNAQAMDSVEGIARFWVGEKRDVVEQCLNELHARGLLAKRTIAGAEFFSLARAASVVSQEGRPEAPRSSGQSRVADPSIRGRLLIIDDDRTVRDMLVSVLSDAGYSVREAEDGERAIKLFRAAPYDIVLTDLKLPGVSGIEVLKAVKELSPSTEVIVITGHASLDTTLLALRHGAYDLLTKPFDEIQVLPSVVERALEKRNLSLDNQLLVESVQAANLELKETVARLAAVHEISRATIGLLDLNELYDSLVRLVGQHLKARRVSALVSEPDSDTMRVVASIGIKDKAISKQQVRVGEGIAGRVAASESPLLVTNIEQSELRDLSNRGGYATPSFICTPLMISFPSPYQRKRVGVINVSDKHSGEPFTEQDLEFLSTLASQVSVAIENARLVSETQGGYLTAMASMVRAIEDAKPKTRGHSRRVAELVAGVAEEMKLSEPRIQRLVQAAVLHEVGRVSAKQGKSSRKKKGQNLGEEWTTPAVVATEKILAPIASLQPVREIIFRSADTFESASLPGVSSKPQIPLESRILAVCEEFARLSPGNAKHPEKTHKALEAIRRQAGKKHDPDVVTALCRVLSKGGCGETTPRHSIPA
ncbi:MAG: response regulator [Acidobacteria bacterium]|nr:response regulator [Acidobacteriota bacterium]